MNATQTWIVIVGLGIGTFLIRFSFLGLIGSKPMPEWVLRHLRYTPVAVLPALVAPSVMWPAATQGEPDPARLIAAVATVGFGLYFRHSLWAIVGGAVTLYAALYLIG